MAGGGWLYLEIVLGSGGAGSRQEGEAPLKLVGSGVDKMFTFWRLDVSPLAPQPGEEWHGRQRAQVPHLRQRSGEDPQSCQPGKSGEFSFSGQIA